MTINTKELAPLSELHNVAANGLLLEVKDFITNKSYDPQDRSSGQTVLEYITNCWKQAKNFAEVLSPIENLEVIEYLCQVTGESYENYKIKIEKEAKLHMEDEDEIVVLGEGENLERILPKPSEEKIVEALLKIKTRDNKPTQTKEYSGKKRGVEGNMDLNI